MYYSTIGFLAVMVLLICNQEVLVKHHEGNGIPALGAYRHFLFGVLLYYITDVLWGILDSLGLHSLLYADTVVYYVAMALGIFLWTRFVVGYLEEENTFGLSLLLAGKTFFGAELIILLINFFRPILFHFDESGIYHAGLARHTMLLIQVLLFLLVSLYILYMGLRNEKESAGGGSPDQKEERAAGGRKRPDRIVIRRNKTIGVFGLVLAALLGIQLFYPLLPLYTIGYMLGTCLLHTFVIEDERAEYRRELEEALAREQMQRQELTSTRQLAYTDSLTGVKSVHAYVELQREMDRHIGDGSQEQFAVAVFDLNELKHINDTLGHETGDLYIINACHIICDFYKHSPVFRIGGDEFMAILKGQDYENRAGLEAAFNRQMEDNAGSGKVVVAQGMSDYLPGQDKSFKRVFERADHNMYVRKQALKDR